MKETTAINWIAYKVVWFRGNCDADEVIGYFQTKESAEKARFDFIEKHNLTENGICCVNSKRVEIEEIILTP
jgi:Icc-related predicted phosphoesterase